MPGLTFSNELISRDEGLHRDFACELYRMLAPELSAQDATGIVQEAVDLEIEFVEDALKEDVIGINARSMSTYIRFVGDHLLSTLGLPKKYNVSNPFDWMEMISLEGKTNFFEKRVGEYAKANLMTDPGTNKFTLDADF